MLSCISRPPSNELNLYQAEITNYHEENLFFGKNSHQPKEVNSKVWPHYTYLTTLHKSVHITQIWPHYTNLTTLHKSDHIIQIWPHYTNLTTLYKSDHITQIWPHYTNLTTLHKSVHITQIWPHYTNLTTLHKSDHITQIRVINKNFETEFSQNWSIWHTRWHWSWPRKSSIKTDVWYSVAQVTTKPIYLTRR